MDESDEEQFALENESMDEVHDVDGELVESLDTSASPAKPQGPTGKSRRPYDSDGSDGGESDASEDFNGGGSSSSSSSSEEERTTRLIERRAPGPGDSHTRRRGSSENDDDDNDEPPEIPGSPMRTASVATSGGGRMNRLSDVDISNCGEVSRHRNQQQNGAPSADMLTISHKGEDEEDDYETKETEAPRAMEFHSSSSSSESENDFEGFGADDDEENNQEEKRYRSQNHENKPRQHHDRPKTAAKDLEPYRELVPKAYYEQLVQGAPPTKGNAMKPTSKTQASRSTPPAGSTQSPPSIFKVRVPREIEELFQHVDAFKPDILDIPIRLQPFIPEYVPAIGVPFDGIQIPRPDGKRDESGVGFVRESCAQSNAAELELLLSTAAQKKQRRRQEQSVGRVHSIDDAAHRPREIDQWIASVAKVQVSKPPPQVIYTKPMPSLTTLMELWPEEFEAYLATQPQIPVSRLDVSLPELVQIVCGLVDIPVYEGLQVHSLHLLFSLYYEVVMYEKEMLRNTR